MGDSATVIDRVDIHGYDLTYAHGDYVMSSGRVVNVLPSTVVRVRTRGGLEGFGEACPLGSTYLPGFAEGARAALRELAPALIGVDAANLAAVNERMDAHPARPRVREERARRRLLGHPRDARRASRWRRCSVARSRPAVPLYVAVPLGPPSEMQAFVERERAGGIHHFQLKLGGAPEDDRDRVAAVHAVTGPEDALIGDANGAWRRQDAIVAARLLGGFDRLRLEQPCPTLEECLAVRRLTTLPMVLDEVITDLPTLVRAVAADAMDHVNLKIGRVGGLTKARLMRDAAVALGLTLTIEDSWGGDIVTAAVAHLAAGVPPRVAVRGLVHERLDARARRRLPAAVARRPRACSGRSGPRASRWTSTGSGRRCSASDRARVVAVGVLGRRARAQQVVGRQVERLVVGDGEILDRGSSVPGSSRGLVSRPRVHRNRSRGVRHSSTRTTSSPWSSYRRRASFA